MKVALLLPMKGVSVRVENKNLRLFNGLPLYHWIMKEVEKSKFINEVIVNTDSDEISTDLNKHFPKAKIHKRPAELIGHDVPMNDIIGYDINLLDSDIIIQTHSTNPLLKVESIDAAISSYIDNKGTYDSVFSVTRNQTRMYWKDGRPINHNPEELIKTQDLPIIYEENSCFYIFSKESFKNSGNKRIGVEPYMYEISKLESVDIDEPEDFTIAELLHKQINTKS